MRKFLYLIIALTVSVLSFAQEKIDRTPKISGFAQFRFDANFDKDFNNQSNTFRFHRVCLSLNGDLTNKLSWAVSGDFVRKPMLVNALVKYTVCNAFAIQAGQFKTPFTIENDMNPAFGCEVFDYGNAIKQLVGYEFSYISPLGALGCDIGVMASGNLKGLEYRIGVFNGNGINNIDNNNNKAFVGRLKFHPIKNFTITGAIRVGEYYCDTLNNGKFNRWTVGVQYKNDRIVLRSEFIGAKTGKERHYPSHIYQTGTVNEPVKSNGFYAVAGYWFNICKGKQKIMPVLRYDRIDADTSIEKSVVNYFTASLYYLPINQLNLKLNYQFESWEIGKEGHGIVAILNFRF